MMIPPRPHEETQRLQVLNSLKVLDTQAEERFDRITRLATRVFAAPIALVSLVDRDRQWFKSRQGLDVSETPRNLSFCAHAVAAEEVLVVPDALEDARFADNPLVSGEPHIRFYAGFPLVSPRGGCLGTFCIIDSQPRQFSEQDHALLADFGHMVAQELFFITQSSTDELTGLSNRRGFRAAADPMLAVCRRAGVPAVLTAFDLNGFKGINDRFGHEEGDRALKDFARCLLKTYREADVIARPGGDEFCVLLSGTGEAGARQGLARLDAALAEVNGQRHPDAAIRYSAGFTALDPVRHESLDDLLRDADAGMYRQKQAR